MWLTLANYQEKVVDKVDGGRFAQLRPTWHEIEGSNRRVLVAKLRSGTVLPIVDSDSFAAHQLVRAAHEEGHEGALSTLQRTRPFAWIPQGRKVAEGITKQCSTCKQQRKPKGV